MRSVERLVKRGVLGISGWTPHARGARRGALEVDTGEPSRNLGLPFLDCSSISYSSNPIFEHGTDEACSSTSPEGREGLVSSHESPHCQDGSWVVTSGVRHAENRRLKNI